MSTLQIRDGAITLSAQDEIKDITGSATVNTVSINALGDVNLSSLQDDQILRYNSTTNKFENEDLPTITETNDLTSAVVWADVPDANITSSSVVQHEGDLTITESQISDLGTYITLASFKAVVAASTDFADFQTRVAAL